jgi:hypothetical protein
LYPPPYCEPGEYDRLRAQRHQLDDLPDPRVWDRELRPAEPGEVDALERRRLSQGRHTYQAPTSSMDGRRRLGQPAARTRPAGRQRCVPVIIKQVRHSLTKVNA